MALGDGPLHLRIISEGIEVCLHRAALAFMAPAAEHYSKRSNAKQHLQTVLAPPGMGKGNAQQIQQKRVSRAEQRKRKATMEEEEERRLKTEAGLCLCDSKCSTTGRYCTKTYLEESSLQKHKDANKCTFPGGVSSRDRLLLLASRPGGALCLNSRPNRQGGYGLFRATQASAIGALGSKEANCYGKFH